MVYLDCVMTENIIVFTLRQKLTISAAYYHQLVVYMTIECKFDGRTRRNYDQPSIGLSSLIFLRIRSLTSLPFEH